MTEDLRCLRPGCHGGGVDCPSSTGRDSRHWGRTRRFASSTARPMKDVRAAWGGDATLPFANSRICRAPLRRRSAILETAAPGPGCKGSHQPLPRLGMLYHFVAHLRCYVTDCNPIIFLRNRHSGEYRYGLVPRLQLNAEGPAMPNMSLSDARIKTLKPRRSAYEVRDGKLKGFGVRVLPSGAKRFFIHNQQNGKRVWKTIADANSMHADEARARAAAMLASVRGDAERADSVGGDPLRVGSRGRFPALCPDLEAPHARGESLVPPSSDPSLVRRPADRRHRPAGRSALVRVPSSDTKCR